MTVTRRRGLRALTLGLVLVTVVLAGTAGAVGTVPPSAPAVQQPLVTELDLRASLTGEFVVVAGWFELTALVDGRLDTTAQQTDLGGTVDVGLAESLGEFAFRGEVVGTVDPSRMRLAFEGDATSLTGAGSVALPTEMSSTGGAVETTRDVGHPAAASLTLVTGEPVRFEPPPGVDPAEQSVRPSPVATSQAVPLQAAPFRLLGVTFLDVYWQLATLVLGVVVVGVLPSFARRVADLGASEPVRTAGAGIVVALVVPVALLLFGLSLFGIPLAVAGVALYLVLWWIGAVYGRFTVGLWLLGVVPGVLAAVDVDTDVPWVENRWAGLLVGVFVVGLLVQIPAVGPVVEAVVLLLGLGGVSRLAYRTYRRSERGEAVHPVGAVTDSRDE